MAVRRGHHDHVGRHHLHHQHHHGHGRVFFGANLAPVVVVPRVIYAPPVVGTAPLVYAVPRVPGYWYYCPSVGVYYPRVATCPVPWTAVPAP